jgi:hypothetical protein
VSSYQQGVLMEEDQRSILIIGGIHIFLPTIPTEASAQGFRCSRKDNHHDCHKGGEGEDTECLPQQKKRSIQLSCSLMGDGVGDVGGLVEQSRTRRRTSRRQSCRLEENASMRRTGGSWSCTSRGTDRSSICQRR